MHYKQNTQVRQTIGVKEETEKQKSFNSTFICRADSNHVRLERQ